MQASTKMKICYLADAADIHTQRWAKYFADKGHEVHLISFRPSSENLENINLHLFKKFGREVKILKYTINPLLNLKHLKELIKEINPDIIHGHSVIDHTIIGGLTGFHPFVVSAWGSDVLIRSKVMRRVVAFTLRRADVITCDGENTKETMMKMGIEREKIKTILHGVDTNKFKPFCGDEKLREGLEIFNSPTVISTRRLGRVHDVGTLINAIPLVLKEIPNAKFIVAGEGEQKKYVMNLAKSLNVFHATRFVGWIPNDELPEYLSSSNVYVSTSLSDSGLSAGTAEAMACGLSVVITDFGDNRKWVEDGVSGFIVPLKDPKVLADKIIYLLKNKDVRMGFGMRNRKIIEERNNYYREMEKMENIYIELVERYKS